MTFAVAAPEEDSVCKHPANKAIAYIIECRCDFKDAVTNSEQETFVKTWLRICVLQEQVRGRYAKLARGENGKERKGEASSPEC